MTIIHPTGEILHILADAGVLHDRLHETARRIAAAYSEANEGRKDTKEAPCPDRS